MHSRRSRTSEFPVLIMFRPQLPSVYHNSSCDGCARDVEENRMRKKNLVEKRSQGKTERHVYISIK